MGGSRIVSLLGGGVGLVAGILLLAAQPGAAAPATDAAGDCPPGVILCFTLPTPPPPPPAPAAPTTTAPHGPVVPDSPVPVTSGPVSSGPAGAVAAPLSSRQPVAPRRDVLWSQPPVADPAGDAGSTRPDAQRTLASADTSAGQYMPLGALLVAAGLGLLVLARGLQPAGHGPPPGRRHPPGPAGHRHRHAA
jgi:hypothetical protein